MQAGITIGQSGISWRSLFRIGNVILSGWKAIANYLDSGIRTVQRWEQQGLPVHRPIPGRRSHVVAHSEQIDRWIERRTTRAGGGADSDLLDNLAKSRELINEIKAAREELRVKVTALRKELAEIRARRKHIS